AIVALAGPPGESDVDAALVLTVTVRGPPVAPSDASSGFWTELSRMPPSGFDGGGVALPPSSPSLLHAKQKSPAPARTAAPHPYAEAIRRRYRVIDGGGGESTRPVRGPRTRP